jgi:hypothetical protein
MPREIRLTLSDNFEVPHILYATDDEGRDKILMLGAEAYDLIYKKGIQLRHASEYESVKHQLEQEYVPKVKELETQIKDSTILIEQQQKKLQQEASDRLELEQRIREEERRNREELLKEKDKAIDAMKKLNDELQQTIVTGQKSVVSELHTMKDQILRTTSSNTAKGAIGEIVFQDYLTKAFGSVGFREQFNLEYKGKEAHMGDIHMEVGDVKSLWEVKNYDTPVPKKEDEKFLKDMETNPQILYGVLVSLHTPIQNHKKSGSTDIRFLQDGRFVCYISEFLKSETPLETLLMLKPYIEALCEQAQNLRTLHTSMEEGSDDDMLCQKVERLQQNRKRILAALQEADTRGKEFYKKFKQAKKNFDDQWILLEESYRPSKDSITNILRAYESVADEEEEEEHPTTGVVESAKPTLRGHIFTKTEYLLYTPDEQQCITQLLKVYKQEDTEETIQKKEFKAAIQTNTGFSDDKVQRLCKAILLADVWGSGHKVKYFSKKEIQPKH